MFELIVGALAVAAMAKIASADNQSPWVWAGVTIALIIASFVLIPLPFIRVGIAFALAFVGMIGYKVAANR